MITNKDIGLLKIYLRDYLNPKAYKEDAEFISKIIETLENSERYRWHDLTKNPDDLPPNDDPVYICREFGKEKIYRIGCYYKDFEDWEGGIDVLAWKEIELFNEENPFKNICPRPIPVEYPAKHRWF